MKKREGKEVSKQDFWGSHKIQHMPISSKGAEKAWGFSACAFRSNLAALFAAYFSCKDIITEHL